MTTACNRSRKLLPHGKWPKVCFCRFASSTHQGDLKHDVLGLVVNLLSIQVPQLGFACWLFHGGDVEPAIVFPLGKMRGDSGMRCRIGDDTDKSRMAF